MYQLLVGSQALRYWYPAEVRSPKDIDYFSPVKMVGCETFWDDRLEHYDPQHWGGVATRDELFTIKVSHAFWDLHGSWQKHMNDVVFLQERRAEFIPELYDLLYSIWEDRYGRKRAYLEASANDFFTSKISRVYDHDSLHASIAYYDEPLFKSILRDGAEVAVDKAKWDMLSYEDQIKLVREEVYATALERRIIPGDFMGSPYAAHTWALKNTITSLSKGWFALFCALNYSELRKPDVDYVARHKDNAHKLIPLEEAS